MKPVENLTKEQIQAIVNAIEPVKSYIACVVSLEPKVGNLDAVFDMHSIWSHAIQYGLPEYFIQLSRETGIDLYIPATGGLNYLYYQAEARPIQSRKETVHEYKLVDGKYIITSHNQGEFFDMVCADPTHPCYKKEGQV